jgi:uncharacterized protein
MTAGTRTITVSGHGSASGVPDLLTLSIGVECRREDVAAAYRAAGELSAAMSAALRQHGVAGPDIGTSGLNVRADVVWQEGRGQVVAGYFASTMLKVFVRDLAASARIIASAVEAGGNDVRLNGLELGFADASEVSRRAREAAWQDAATAAGHFAALSGQELGPVISVTQQPQNAGPIPVPVLERAMASQPLAVEAGESSVHAAVTVVWELRSP